MKRYLKRFKLSFILAVIFSVLAGFVDVCFTLLLKGVIDKVSARSTGEFTNFCVKAILISIFMAIIIYVNKIVKARLIKNVNCEIKNDIYKGIQKLNIVEYRKKNTGYFLSILSNDVKLIESDYFSTILVCFYEISIFITALIATISINFYLAVFLIILSLIPMTIPFVFNKALIKAKGNYSDAMCVFVERIKDILSAFEIIKAFNIKRNIADEFNVHNNTMENNQYAYTRINAISSSVSVGVMYITYFLSLLISGCMAINDVISIGSMIVSVNLVGNIANPLMSISSNISTLRSTRLIRDKILEVIDYNNLLQVDKKLKIRCFNKIIDFKNVSFSYNSNNKILSNINLSLYKNKKYAIVGESGSGKSTLVKLLLNYYNTYSGNIFIDDKNVKNIKEEDMFKLISIIQQDVFIFDDTIKNNITLFKDYCDDDLRDALQKVNLVSIINSLEDNLETNMGESGDNFSGGQKQRIALARAIIKKCPIIILDEATASLDNDTAYKIEKSLLDMQDLTLISITHKLIRENLKMYDEIIYIRNGQIIEKGTFDALMNIKGNFYSLYMLQN
ncbi:MAG: ABC transporter ATP-binding protein [Clostridium sp.]|nr:ABC transporter ATP-binding protein [Clostridium sp.]